MAIRGVCFLGTIKDWAICPPLKDFSPVFRDLISKRLLSLGPVITCFPSLTLQHFLPDFACIFT